MGRLIGIAKATEKLAPLEEMAGAAVTIERGIEGDCRGANTDRQITILFREGWEAACAQAGAKLPWVARRANLFVEDMDAPHEGARISIGGVVLEVTKETKPCHLMDKAHMGLKNALTPGWRGGVCCNVIAGGTIRLCDAVTVKTSS
jgi:MOSC domain-containing protein YiiM